MNARPPDNTLRLIFWELTARCNLRCAHCRAEAADAARPDELTTDEVLAAMRDMRSTFDPIVVLTGGEPLVRDDIFTLAETACRTFTRVALASNGTLIDHAVAERIQRAGLARVSVSLDGADAETHDRFRGRSGAFDAAVNGLRSLRRAGVSTQVNVTVTAHNRDQLPDLLVRAVDLGADAFHVFVLVPVGCGAQLAESDRLDPEHTERTLAWLFERSIDPANPIHIKATCAPQYFRIARQIARQRDRPAPAAGHGMHAATRGCLAGSGVCFISRTGDVQPCGYLPIRAGNIRQASLKTIWDTADIFTELRDPDRLKGKCRACDFRAVCGGCRARAYAIAADPLAADPDCPHRP